MEWNAVVHEPQDRHAKAKDKVAQNPWDVDAWNAFLKEAIESRNPQLIRETYKALLDQFPTSAAHWLQWLRYEERHSENDEMERLFDSSLRTVLSVDLCRYYLSYIQAQQAIETKQGSEEKRLARETITGAFDFVLALVGTDKDAGVIYQDYAKFIKSVDALTSWEEQQRMDQLRKIYSRAVCIPLNNIEVLWQEYDSFENSLNKITAKKLIGERAPSYMSARGVLRDMKMLLEPIERAQEHNWLATPPSWLHKEIQLLNAWKRYIAWETSNPMHLEDKNALVARVIYVYRKAVMMLRFYPEVWYDACQYLVSQNKPDEASALIKSGCEVNSTSLLLAFTRAETEEKKQSEFSELQSVFDELLSHLEKQYSSVNEAFDTESSLLLKMLQDADEKSLKQSKGDDETAWDGEVREKQRELQRDREKEVHLRVELKREKKLNEIKSAVGLTWIMYMRFARRSQGIKAARTVFSKARKSSLASHHVYVASALMEYYVNKDAVIAGKIFELGMKTFNLAEDKGAAEFVSQYLDFLLNLNDDNNIRALFERALAALPVTESEKIWEKYFDYENQYGDLNSLEKIVNRRGELFPKDNLNSVEWLYHVSDKWKYRDLDYIGQVELGIPALKSIKRKAPPSLSAKPVSHGGQNARRGERRGLALESVTTLDYPRPDMSKYEIYKAEPGQAIVLELPGHVEPEVVPERMEREEPDMMLPEPISVLLAALPSRDHFPGPFVVVEELIHVVMSIPIPLPITLPPMVPYKAPISMDGDRASPAMGRPGPRVKRSYRDDYRDDYRREDDYQRKAFRRD